MITTSLVLATQRKLHRELMSHFLGRREELAVVATTDVGESCVEAAFQHRPEVIITDIDPPDFHVFEGIRRIKLELPRTAVILSGDLVTDLTLREAVGAGISGYITDDEGMDNMVAAIRTVAAGGTYFSPSVQERLYVNGKGIQIRPNGTRSISKLTNREREVLKDIASGLHRKDISKKLNISPRTVARHTANLMVKLDIHDRVRLARYAIREGFVAP
ncbi:Transcriptional regulatory protein DegU [Planctomycetes bacterium Pan216]|uniref:Transcriptional regulatory protein DegU n=1 Tax=Kolteria novifilia TaxID=2527975 RepID=A0A518AXH9_9BACT|nr:Transcriptional regulatory protein DegU [Planctomycetes bacterium Pan216]